ncbi:uncharacterized protein PAC_16299 [Phialocephala subalpina]|uniref:Uncharacterized protein n=1 Tax=Phialocephala subalpina TaxID=576137 RepID=A0A1L7XMZ9_9HELO|nr:uncharacterized protein PAC_16299 [Phialocephala subalpina]
MMEGPNLTSHNQELPSNGISVTSDVSTPPDVGVSQNDPGRYPTVQIDMAAPPTGLRNRARQIPDAMPHLSSRGRNDRPRTASNIRSIACALVRLDIWALNTIESSYLSNPQLIGVSYYNQFKALVSKSAQDLANGDDLYEDRFETEVQRDLERLFDDEILGILCDARTSTYYAQFIRLRILLYTTASTEIKYTADARNVRIPEDDANKWKTPQKYMKYLTIQLSETKLRLRSVVLGCQDLRSRIKHAAELGEIPPIALAALKKKMEALQVNYGSACYQLRIYKDNSLVLVELSYEDWWNLADEAKQAKDVGQPRSNVAEAYPKSSKVISTLSFLVPAVCLLSCIPAGLAWVHTPYQVGTHNDGNFYQLLSGSTIQLLGTGTLIYPSLFSGRMVGLPRFWAWVLIGTSILCTGLSLPLLRGDRGNFDSLAWCESETIIGVNGGLRRSERRTAALRSAVWEGSIAFFKDPRFKSVVA